MRGQDGHGESRGGQAGQKAGRETAARAGKETAGRAKEPGGAVERSAKGRSRISARSGLRLSLVSTSAFQLVVWWAGRPAYGACRMPPSILARGWGSMEGTAVCAFGPIGARVGGGDRLARQIAGLSL